MASGTARIFRAGGLALAALVVMTNAAQAAAPATITYYSKSIVEIRGQVEVADFGYVPANPKHKDNQIPNTAIGSIKLAEPVGVFLANGLRQELRTSGVSLLPGARCRLSGAVKAIRIDDLGLDSDFSLTADYVLTDAAGHEIYRHEQSTAFMASKFGGGPVSISQLFSANINGVIGSDDFIKRFEAACPRTGG